MKRLAVVLALAFAGTAAAEPPTTHEILDQHPVSFWGNTYKSTNGSYRYRLLGIGVAIAGIMGIVMIRLVKKANATPRPAIEVAPPRY